MSEPTFGHERLDVYRLSIEYVAFSYRIAKTLAGLNMLTRLIQRKQTVAEYAIEYEYDYRDAEYEYEERRIGEA